MQRPAELSLQVSPKDLDTGDRLTVEIEIDSIANGSAAVKARMPVGLQYVAKSAKLQIGDGFIKFEPTTTAADAQYRYLVFYVGTSTLAPEDHGTITFILSAAAPVDEGEVEVDADVDDPAISNSKEFKIADPKFDPQDGVTIRVRGTVAATPTPTPAAN